MKLLYSLSLLCIFSGQFIVGMDDHDDLAHSVVDEYPITCSLAKSWEDVEEYKNSVYMPFFEKVKFEKKYLEDRWNFLHDLYKTELISIMLLQKEKPIGFMTVEHKNENALLYTSPVLLSQKETEYALNTLFVKQYPAVKKLYCIANSTSSKLQRIIEELGFSAIENSKLPIEPNKEFMDQIPFISFEKNLHQSSNSHSNDRSSALSGINFCPKSEEKN